MHRHDHWLTVFGVRVCCVRILVFPGAGLSVEVILILGFSSIFADAVSMGAGDAMSTKAENDYIMMERKREKWFVCCGVGIRSVGLCSSACWRMCDAQGVRQPPRGRG